MTDINFKKAILTIGLSVCCSLIGLEISKISSIDKEFALYIFPFLFGISIPIANWTDLGALKIPKIALAGLLSTGLFYGAVSLFSNSEFSMYLISGINGVILLWLYSKIIETVQPTIINYSIVIVLCLLALGLSSRNLYSRGIPDFDLLFKLWTSFFTVGLTTCIQNKHTAVNTVFK